MAQLASLAGRLAQVALVGPAIARLKRRAARTALGGALLALSGLGGLVFLLAALRTWLDGMIGPIWSPAAIGAGLLVCAGIAGLVFLKPRATKGEKAATQAEALHDTLVGPARAREDRVARHPLQSLAIALAAGFAGATLLRLRRGRRPAAPLPRDDDNGRMRDAALHATHRRKGNGLHP